MNEALAGLGAAPTMLPCHSGQHLPAPAGSSLVPCRYRHRHRLHCCSDSHDESAAQVVVYRSGQYRRVRWRRSNMGVSRMATIRRCAFVARTRRSVPTDRGAAQRSTGRSAATPLYPRPAPAPPAGFGRHFSSHFGAVHAPSALYTCASVHRTCIPCGESGRGQRVARRGVAASDR